MIESEAKLDWERKLKLYPSLRKLDELGDDYTEWNDGREETLLTAIRSRPDFDQLKGNPAMVLDAMDEFSRNEDSLISVGDNKARKLTSIVENHKPKVLVELGGYLGYSAILFGDNLRKIHGEGLHVWSIEFEPRFADIARELIGVAGLADTVKVITGASDKVLRELKAEHGIEEIDLLFLDHVEDLYVRDLNVASSELGLLPRGALAVADNVIRPGAPKYLKLVRSSPRFESEGIKSLIMPGEYEDEIEVTRILR